MKDFRNYDSIGMEDRLLEMCNLLESCVEFLEEEEIDMIMEVNGWSKYLNIMDLVDREKYRLMIYKGGIFKNDKYSEKIYRLYGGGLEKIEERKEYVLNRYWINFIVNLCMELIEVDNLDWMKVGNFVGINLREFRDKLNILLSLLDD